MELVYCLWCLTPLQQNFSYMYIMAVSFIGGGNWSTRRKPPTCCKSMTKLIRVGLLHTNATLKRNHHIHVWFILVQWIHQRRFKCNLLSKYMGNLHIQYTCISAERKISQKNLEYMYTCNVKLLITMLLQFELILS